MEGVVDSTARKIFHALIIKIECRVPRFLVKQSIFGHFFWHLQLFAARHSCNYNCKVAVVIGGGGFLCSKMAEGLAKAGAEIVILDLRISNASKKIKEIEKNLKKVCNCEKHMRKYLHEPII